MPAKSKSQQRLLGWAYACSKGKSDNCPDWLMDIAKSFIKKSKRKGLKNLKDFAKTKHDGLPERVERNPKPRKKKRAKNESYVLDFDSFLCEGYSTDEVEDVLMPLVDDGDCQVFGDEDIKFFKFKRLSKIYYALDRLEEHGSIRNYIRFNTHTIVSYSEKLVNTITNILSDCIISKNNQISWNYNEFNIIVQNTKTKKAVVNVSMISRLLFVTEIPDIISTIIRRKINEEDVEVYQRLLGYDITFI